MKPNKVKPKSAVSIAILWGIIIPQSLLLYLNFHSWMLVVGEADERTKIIAAEVCGFEILVLIASVVALFLYKSGRLRIEHGVIFTGLVLHIGFMWFLLAHSSELIPQSVQPWIANEAGLGRWNITLFMPGAFLSLFALSQRFFANIPRSTRMTFILGSSIGIPVFWYLSVSLLQPLWFGEYAIVVSAILGTVLVLVFLMGLINFFGSWIHLATAGDFGEKYYLSAIVLGLAAPIGGLILNKNIPFPADFQSDGVYIFTVINGLLLLWKPTGDKFALHRLFVRCATLPFIAYFFFVFLPFLPLSLFALIALGAGFLMLTPLALGLFQARISYEEYKHAANAYGKQKATLIGVLGLLILPSLFATQALLDKQALDKSLNYFYARDTASAMLSQFEIERAAQALVQLRDRKAGVQLPYIAGFYNSLVFGQMVLSDEKLSRMYSLLKAEPLPEPRIDLLGSPRSSRNWARGLVPPKRDVEITRANTEYRGDVATTLSLTMTNNSHDTHALYVGRIHVPDGVFVTGLRLKIADEWVDGKIFDRKTALWIFQKITEVRRDPALLYYRSPNELELRVYPFPTLGIREVEIDFAFHPLSDSRIMLDDQSIALSPVGGIHTVTTSSGGVADPALLREMSFTREPTLHVILDYSAASKASTEDYVEKITEIAARLNIDRLQISAANIGMSDAAEPLDVENKIGIAKRIEGIELPKVGGLWIEQALSKQIMNIAKSLDRQNFRQRPVVVVVSEQAEIAVGEIDISAWDWLIPDLRVYLYRQKELERVVASSLPNDSKPTKDRDKIVVLEFDSKITALAVLSSSIVDFDASEPPRIYDPVSDSFAPITLVTDPRLKDSNWPHYATTWSKWRSANMVPAELEARRTEFIEESKQAGVLLPLSSLIVVESASQWEILKRKEQQSLNAHSALDFEQEQQTPEPPWWLLLIALLGFIYVRERRLTS